MNEQGKNVDDCLIARCGFHLFELLIIVFPYRSHPSVPPQKIKPVVAFKELVMLVMIYRGIDPSSYFARRETFGIEFES